MLLGAAPRLAEGEGFVSPGPKDFDFPPFFESVPWFTKPVLIVMLATLLVFLFYYAASRNPKVELICFTLGVSAAS